MRMLKTETIHHVDNVARSYVDRNWRPKTDEGYILRNQLEMTRADLQLLDMPLPGAPGLPGRDEAMRGVLSHLALKASDLMRRADPGDIVGIEGVDTAAALDPVGHDGSVRPGSNAKVREERALNVARLLGEGGRDPYEGGSVPPAEADRISQAFGAALRQGAWKASGAEAVHLHRADMLGDRIERIERNRRTVTDPDTRSAYDLLHADTVLRASGVIAQAIDAGALDHRALSPVDVAVLRDAGRPAVAQTLSKTMDAAEQAGTHPRDYGYYDGEPEIHTLADEKCGMLAMLVHAHLVHAGRDPRGSSMFVAWADDEAYLKILAPGPDGLEKVTLPNHLAVEEAIAGRFPAGLLEVAYGEDFPDHRPAGTGAIASFAEELGIAPADMGLANLPDDRNHGERIVDALAHVLAPTVPVGSHRTVTVMAREDGPVARIRVEDWNGQPRREQVALPPMVMDAIHDQRNVEGGRDHAPLWPTNMDHHFTARIPAVVDALPPHLAEQELQSAIDASRTNSNETAPTPRHDPAVMRAVARTRGGATL